MIEGALLTLKDPESRKAAAVQTAGIMLNGRKGTISIGAREPNRREVQEAIEALEGRLSLAEGFSAAARVARAAVKYDPKLHPKDRTGRFAETPDAPKPAPKPMKKAKAPGRPDPGVGSKPKLTREQREAKAAAAYPLGSSVTTTVHGMNGVKPVKVTGEVVGHKFGQLRVKTEAHGTLAVDLDKVEGGGKAEKSSTDGASKGYKGKSTGALPSPAGGEPAGDDDEVIDCGSDINKAADLLQQGKRIQLDQPRTASTLVKELARRVNEAKEKGEKAPNFNLCGVTVPGTNLFCAESKGVPRIQMPQLSGVPTPGSRADNLPKNEKGEVDLGPLFRKMLEDRNVPIEDADEKASFLKASQNELNGGKVSGMTGALDAGKKLGGNPRLFVSSDNYIVDGHHRWAANVAHDLQDGKLGDVDMPIARVDMPILELLAESNQFALDWGIPQASVGAPVPEAKGAGGGDAARAEMAKALGLKEAGAAMGPPIIGQPTATAQGPKPKPKAKPKVQAKNRAGKKPGETRQPKDQDFEKLHPRARGGIFMKKGEGMAGQPSPQVAQAQRRLVQLGYGPGAPDGKYGPLTQAAVAKFQTDYGLRPSGEIDPATAQLMASPPERKVTDIQAEQKALESVPDAQGRVASERSSRGTTSSRATATEDAQTEGVDSELDQGAESSRSRRSSSGRSKSSRSTSSTDGVIGEGEGVDGEPSGAVEVIQKALDQLGYDLGKFGVDGRFGPYTDRAVRKLQRQHGLKADGKVGKRTQRLIRRLLQRSSEISKAKDRVLSADEQVIQEAHMESGHDVLSELRSTNKAPGERILHGEVKPGLLTGSEDGAQDLSPGSTVMYRLGDEQGMAVVAESQAGVPSSHIRVHVTGLPDRVMPRSAFAVWWARRDTDLREAPSLVDRFDDATVRRVLTEGAEQATARSTEVALARLVAKQAGERLSIAEARAVVIAGIERADARTVLREAGCSMPHDAMVKKGMKKCPNCKASLKSKVEEGLSVEEHRTLVDFIKGGWRDLEEAAGPKIPLGDKPGKNNWVDKAGGLPKYIKRIAEHIKGKHPEYPDGRCIAIAVNAVKKMCASGDVNFPGAQQVNAKSRAQACKAVAEWEAKKARSKG